MKMIKLEKQKHNEPKFDELSQMIGALFDFLDEDANPNDKDWSKNLNTIIDFQDSDGSFKLFDSYEIPSDAKVDFCWLPTYLCSAILMKACLTDPSSFTLKEKSALSKGLEASCAKNLRGHGFEALKGQIDSLKIFMKAGLNEFMDLHSDLCPEFTGMIDGIISKFKDMQSKGEFTGPWGESYGDEIKAVNEYFCQRIVFVYGTLMSGEGNHHYLENAKCLGKGTVAGYDMYNVGWFPAIVPGNGLIVGELYKVSLEDVPAIDSLEGEGHLYSKKCETVTDAKGNRAFALIYVYMGDCSDLERIQAWGNDYVWYVSYGSNMLRKGFMRYINGGSFEDIRDYTPCEDTTPPVAVKTVEIPYDMYFGHESGTWKGYGVSFIDITKNGKALGVAYLITRKQFEHVVYEENGGRTQNPSYGWYEDTIDLGVMDGFETKTITNKNSRMPNRPCEKYMNILRRGIRQNWPDMSDKEIDDYLEGCKR